VQFDARRGSPNASKKALEERSPFPLRSGGGWDAPPYLRIQLSQHQWGLAVAKGASPFREVFSRFLDHIFQSLRSRSPHQISDPHITPFQSRRRIPPPCLPPRRNAESKEFPRPWPGNRGFPLIYLQQEFLGEELADALYH
jgi:hypothetical protein